jgi:hypothetical protein
MRLIRRLPPIRFAPRRFKSRSVPYPRSAPPWLSSGRFRFCPDCGSTVYWDHGGGEGSVAVAVGAFADPGFPPPTVSVYATRRHPWVSLPPSIVERWD